MCLYVHHGPKRKIHSCFNIVGKCNNGEHSVFPVQNLPLKAVTFPPQGVSWKRKRRTRRTFKGAAPRV